MTVETRERETMNRKDLALLNTAWGALKEAQAILNRMESRERQSQDLRDKLMGA